MPGGIKFTGTIKCHGAPYLLQRGGEGSPHFQSGYAAATQYARDPNNQNVKRIELRSCHSAAGGTNSTAQQYANATGAKVTGYKSVYTASSACSSPVDFLPQTPNSAEKSAYNNVQGYLQTLSDPKFRF